jgi:preprotein translocase subunit SecD
VIADDPLLAEIEDANPVPRSAKPEPRHRLEADRVLERVLARPPRRHSPWRIVAPVASVLVVVAVVAAAFRIGGPHGSRTGGKHGLQVVLQAEPTPQAPVVTPDALSRTVEIVRQRLDALAPGFTVEALGPDRVVVSGRPVSAAEQAWITTLSSQTAQLSFYDWEAEVLTPDGKTVASRLVAHDPSALTTSQGSASAAPGEAAAGGMTLYDAVLLAARQPRSRSVSNSRKGPEYFLFGPPGSASCAAAASARGTLPTAGQHCLLAGPVSESSATSRRQALADLAAQLPPSISPSNGQLLVVRRGTVVLEGTGTAAFASPAARFFVLRDRVALTGADITNPKLSTDSAGNYDVGFGFTPTGARRFQTVTARVAHRGRLISTAGMTLEQHFAIALDKRLLTVPSIDFRQYPDGISGSQGADIAGGFTTRSARILAVELRYGTLPLNLVLPLKIRVVH